MSASQLLPLEAITPRIVAACRALMRPVWAATTFGLCCGYEDSQQKTAFLLW